MNTLRCDRAPAWAALQAHAQGAFAGFAFGSDCPAAEGGHFASRRVCTSPAAW